MARTFAVVKASYTRNASEAKASVRYMQHRQNDLGERETRLLFDRQGEVSRQQAYERLDQAEEQPGKTYYYRLVLNPGEGHADLDEEGRQAWTAQVMQRIEEQGLKVRDWVAVSHTDQGEHDHIHVVAALSRTLQKDELAELRTYSREAYTQQKDLQLELGIYQEDPRTLLDLEEVHQRHRELEVERQQQHQRQHSLDWDY